MSARSLREMVRAREGAEVARQRFAPVRPGPRPDAPLRLVQADHTRVDLVLVEGFKREGHPKIEVHRAANAKPFMHPHDPTIQAVASDAPVQAGVPVLHLDDIPAIADAVLAYAVPVAR